jgi:hypothetical protein
MHFSKDSKYGLPISRPHLLPDEPCNNIREFPVNPTAKYFMGEIRGRALCNQYQGSPLDFTAHALEGPKNLTEYEL